MGLVFGCRCTAGLPNIRYHNDANVEQVHINCRYISRIFGVTERKILRVLDALKTEGLSHSLSYDETSYVFRSSVREAIAYTQLSGHESLGLLDGIEPSKLKSALRMLQYCVSDNGTNQCHCA